MDSVCVSIDGATPEAHQKMRGHPRSFEWAVSAVKTLKARGVRTIVGFTPTVLNLSESTRIIDFAAEIGADAVNLSEYVPTGRGTISLCPRPDELRSVIETWARRKEELRGRIDVYWHDCRVGDFLAPEERAKYIGCGAGSVLCRITYDGKVAPCVTLPVEAGDLRKDRFKTIWDNSPLFRRLRDRRNIRSGNCSVCDKLETCGGCRSVSNGFYGDPFLGDPYCWVHPEEDAWTASTLLPITEVVS